MAANIIESIFEKRQEEGLHYRFYTYVVCLAWELNLEPRFILDQLDALIGRKKFTAFQLWAIELYAESPTSYEEGKAVAHRLAAYVKGSEEQRQLRAMLLEIVPRDKKAECLSQPLMAKLDKYMVTPTFPWLGFRLSSASESDAPITVERETAFDYFLSVPGFKSAFAQYWRKAPKRRSNIETRVLIYVSAIIRGLCDWSTPHKHACLTQKLKEQCLVSEETAVDILKIGQGLFVRHLDPSWLGQNFAADAKEKDRIHFSRFMEACRCDANCSDQNHEFAQKVLYELSYTVSHQK